MNLKKYFDYGVSLEQFDENREKLKNGEVDRSVINIKIRKFYAVDKGEKISDSIIKALNSK